MTLPRARCCSQVGDRKTTHTACEGLQIRNPVVVSARWFAPPRVLRSPRAKGGDHRSVSGEEPVTVGHDPGCLPTRAARRVHPGRSESVTRSPLPMCQNGGKRGNPTWPPSLARSVTGLAAASSATARGPVRHEPACSIYAAACLAALARAQVSAASAGGKERRGPRMVDSLRAY